MKVGISNSRKMLKFFNWVEGIKRTFRFLNEQLYWVMNRSFTEAVYCRYERKHKIQLRLHTILELIPRLVKLSAKISNILFKMCDDVVLLTQLKLISPRIIKNFGWMYLKNLFAMFYNLLLFVSSSLEVVGISYTIRDVEKDILKSQGGN